MTTTPTAPVAQIDLSHLEQLARAATRGPWSWWTSNSTLRLTGGDGRDGGVLYGYVHSGDGDVYCSEQNQAFIAATNPAAVLELIALARAALNQSAQAAQGECGACGGFGEVVSANPSPHGRSGEHREDCGDCNGAGIAANAAPTQAAQGGMAQECQHCNGDGYYEHKGSDTACRVCGGSGAALDMGAQGGGVQAVEQWRLKGTNAWYDVTAEDKDATLGTHQGYERRTVYLAANPAPSAAPQASAQEGGAA